MKEEILKIFNEVNATVSMIATFLTSSFGTQWMLFAGYFILNVIDYITGVVKAKKQKKESSKIGINGVMKKVCYWILIAITFILSYMIAEILNKMNLEINLNFIMFFGWFTLACLAINEARSILENFVEIGIAIPQFLIIGLEIVQDKMENVIEKDIESNTEEMKQK